MKRQIAVWKVLAGVLAVLTLSSGGAVALAAGGGEPATQAPPDNRGTLTPNRSTTYVPLTPCRIFSTTPPSVPGFGDQQSRTVKVVGNLSTQGGQAAGCGIPAAATAIEAAVSATFNQGDGYLRTYPAGQGEPQATFLNYTDAGASTNTGAITIAPGGGSALTVKNYRSVTDVVIDVQGYYVRPLYVLVNADGSVQSSSRLLAVSKDGTGQYNVNFEVNTDTCVRTVTVGRSRIDVAASSGFGSAHLDDTPVNSVTVLTYDVSGSLADRSFMLEVSC